MLPCTAEIVCTVLSVSMHPDVLVPDVLLPDDPAVAQAWVRGVSKLNKSNKESKTKLSTALQNCPKPDHTLKPSPQRPAVLKVIPPVQK